MFFSYLYFLHCTFNVCYFNACLSTSSDPLHHLTCLQLTIPADRVGEVSGAASSLANAAVAELRSLLLCEKWLDTLKFAASLICLTYIGSWFNLLTLVILTWVGAFTLPRIYRDNRVCVFFVANANAKELS